MQDLHSHPEVLPSTEGDFPGPNPPNFDPIPVVRRGGAISTWGRALRLHQWTKSVLLALPALAAHLPWDLNLVWVLTKGLLAFSLAASVVYLWNDVYDLADDRLHPTKRLRPLAAGQIRVAGVATATAVLVTATLLLSASLPAGFQRALGVYVVLATLYCVLLKRIALVDVLMLATLYTVRVVAGAALVEVPLSRWFLAFSVFFFLSLALVKRVVELKRSPNAERDQVRGRGYRPQDLPVVVGLGLGATTVSCLVYCLYVTSDDMARYYARPDFLWAGLLLLLYWQARVWLLAGRNEMADDPVVFALRDRVSRVVLAAFLAMVALASR